MRIVVALGGNALIRRGGSFNIEAQRKNVQVAVTQLARIAIGNDLVIVHGNGPQVGLLALQAMDDSPDERLPLHMLSAETVGTIGYMIQQELGNLIDASRSCVTLLTMVEVFASDPAFAKPDKPIGPIYSEQQATDIASERGWTVGPDGDNFRRLVPSPKPVRVIEINPVQWLLEHNTVVICAGGGGIPVIADNSGNLYGVEAIVDKDRTANLVANALNADLLIIATDVDGVYENWGTPRSTLIRHANPSSLAALGFATGSMGPKVEAACDFSHHSRRRAVIGSIEDIEKMVAGISGTTVACDAHGITYASPVTT